MKIIKLSKECRFEVKEVENGYAGVSNELNKSLIEIVYLEKMQKNNMCMIVDEEGKLKNLDIVLAFTKNGSIVDLGVGDIIICGEGTEGEFISLTDNQIMKFKGFLEKCIFKKGKESLRIWSYEEQTFIH